MMRILGVSGSLRAGSSNTALLRALPALAPEGVEIVFAAPLDRLPHFNPDLDGEAPPSAVGSWRAELESAEGVVISSPEYAHGIPGVLKNALDWDVSSGKLAGKPVALITASPSHLGAAKAQASLIQTLSAMSACIVDQASIDLPAVYKKFDEEGNLIDPEIIRLLQERMERFAAAIKTKSARDAV